MTTLDIQRPGPIGRLGGFAADHARAIAITWAIAALVLAAFAPKVETALSGAGWQADGSESVQARALIERSFERALELGADGRRPLRRPRRPRRPRSATALARVERVLAGDARVASVRPGPSPRTATPPC